MVSRNAHNYVFGSMDFSIKWGRYCVRKVGCPKIQSIIDEMFIKFHCQKTDKYLYEDDTRESSVNFSLIMISTKLKTVEGQSVTIS